MDDYLAKPFTIEQMRAMLTTWLGAPERPAMRERLSLVTEAAAAPDPIDEQVLASLGRLQREGRPDIAQQLIELFFKDAAGLLMDLENGAATGDAALLYRASHALKSASANLGAIVLSTHCKELEVLSNLVRLPTLRCWSRQSAKTIAPSKPDFQTAGHRSPDFRVA